MIIIVKIFKFILNVIYSIFKLFKTKNRITFISRQSNSVNIDFLLLGEEINKKMKGYDVVYLCKTLDTGFLNKVKYVFHMFKQMYYISTSKVVILDSYCIVISNCKHKKSLTVIQMWHAMGAFKKFGLSVVNNGNKRIKHIDNNKLASVMNMHNNYDYIFASSEYCVKYFSEAFGQDKSKFRIYPLPRLDLMVDKNNIKKVSDKIYSKYPKLKNKKKNILYCPTFRDGGYDYKYIKEFIDNFNYKKYNLIVKLHPLTKYKFDNSEAIFDNTFNTYEMVFVSDKVISDYSAVIYEVAVIGKPMMFYAYDKKEYVNDRDFYLKYDKDMPGKICLTLNELYEEIDNDSYDMNKLYEFKEKYIKEFKKSYTCDIIDFVEICVCEDKYEKIKEKY